MTRHCRALRRASQASAGLELSTPETSPPPPPAGPACSQPCKLSGTDSCSTSRSGVLLRPIVARSILGSRRSRAQLPDWPGKSAKGTVGRISCLSAESGDQDSELGAGLSADESGPNIVQVIGRWAHRAGSTDTGPTAEAARRFHRRVVAMPLASPPVHSLLPAPRTIASIRGEGVSWGSVLALAKEGSNREISSGSHLPSSQLRA
jgi:hypothetical protein